MRNIKRSIFFHRSYSRSYPLKRPPSGRKVVATIKIASPRMACLLQHGAPTLRQYLRGSWQLTRTMRHAETEALMGTVHGGRATFRDAPPPPQAPQGQLLEQPQQPEQSLQPSQPSQPSQPPQPPPQQPEPPRQLLYREEGEVNFSPNAAHGRVFPFYREYMYTFTSPTQADVHFYQPNSKEAGDHLKFFHTLSIDEASGAGVTSEHLCINDLYLATVRITSPSAFEMSWRVTGPQKNYQIVTRFARMKEEEEEAAGGTENLVISPAGAAGTTGAPSSSSEKAKVGEE